MENVTKNNNLESNEITEKSTESSNVIQRPENELDIKRFGHTMTLGNR